MYTNKTIFFYMQTKRLVFTNHFCNRKKPHSDA